MDGWMTSFCVCRWCQGWVDSVISLINNNVDNRLRSRGHSRSRWRAEAYPRTSFKTWTTRGMLLARLDAHSHHFSR